MTDYFLTFSDTSPAGITAAIQNASVSGRQIYFPAGTYKVDPIFVNASNVQYIGAFGSETLLECDNDVIFELGSCDNVRFQELCFKGTGNSDAINYLGLITTRNQVNNGLAFIGCQFTVPDRNANGIKIICDTPSSLINQLSVSGCSFTDIGRMVIEVQNHQSGYTTIRSVDINGNSFSNTGLKSNVTADHHGNCVSISGAANGVYIGGLTINDPYDIAIEAVGAITGLVIENCTLSNLNRRNTEDNRPLSILSIEPGIWSPSFEFVGVQVKTITCADGGTSGAVYMRNVTYSLIQNCKFVTPDYERGYWSLVNCSWNNFWGNEIFAKGVFGFLLQHSDNTTATRNNQFSSTIISCVNSPFFYAAIQTKGTNVFQNQWRGGRISLPPGQINYLNDPEGNGNDLIDVIKD